MQTSYQFINISEGGGRKKHQLDFQGCQYDFQKHREGCLFQNSTIQQHNSKKKALIIVPETIKLSDGSFISAHRRLTFSITTLQVLAKISHFLNRGHPSSLIPFQMHKVRSDYF